MRALSCGLLPSGADALASITYFVFETLRSRAIGEPIINRKRRARAFASRPAVIAVEGEAGFGKSRLISEFLASGGARERFLLVCGGARQRGERTILDCQPVGPGGGVELALGALDLAEEIAAPQPRE